MRYQNICSGVFAFATKHACDRRTDGQTDGQNYDFQGRASIAASKWQQRVTSDLRYDDGVPMITYYWPVEGMHPPFWISPEPMSRQNVTKQTLCICTVATVFR